MTGTDPQSANAARAGRMYFPAVDTHLISSAFVRQTFKVQVVLPPQCGVQEARYPVVFATDGNSAFDMLMGMTRLLHSAQVEIMPFILVAIGYPSHSPVAGERLRGRDFTFEGCPDYCRGVQWDWEGILPLEADTKGFAGAGDFQNFIGSELIPFIDRRYPTIADERTYFGHSAGGGFGLYTLFTNASLFRNYLISSPILSYDGKTPDGSHYQMHNFMFDVLREFIAAGSSLPGVRMHMSVGSEEEYRPVIAHWQFTSSFHRFIAALKSAPIAGLELSSEVLVGETHITAWPIAFLHGIKRLFALA